MKKLILSLMIAGLAAINMVSAQEAPKEEAPAAAPAVMEKTAVVDSIDSGKLVLDDQGTKVSFEVKDTAKVTDAEGNVLELAKIEKGKKVKVEYVVTAEGTNDASTVSVIKE